MLYILDTDHLSLLQRGNQLVNQRVFGIPASECAITAISVTEQFLGWWNQITQAKSETMASIAFLRLQDTVVFYQSWQMLPYDSAAVAEFERLRKAKVRIGTQDLRIAAIALSNSATVVTRNLRDFRQVPNLSVIDWSIPTPSPSP